MQLLYSGVLPHKSGHLCKVMLYITHVLVQCNLKKKIFYNADSPCFMFLFVFFGMVLNDGYLKSLFLAELLTKKIFHYDVFILKESNPKLE